MNTLAGIVEYLKIIDWDNDDEVNELPQLLPFREGKVLLSIEDAMYILKR